MQVFVEKTSELSRKMTVRIPEATVQEKMDSRLKSLAKEVKVHGFRPGKVPAQVVKKMYGDKIRGEISGDLIESSYYEALKQENLIPAGQPHIQPGESSDDLEYIAEFEVYPEISLAGVNSLALSCPKSEVTESDVDEMIEKLRQQQKTWEAVDRAASNFDKVTINFNGVVDGETLTNGQVEEFPIEIGSQQMLAGFEEQLIDLTVGGQKTFNITLPDNYSNAQFAGKSCEFNVEVLKVEQAVLPELTAEFVKTYGVESGDLNDFRADVLANMQRELQHGLKSKQKNSVFDALLNTITISIPKALLDNEMQVLLKPYIEQAKKKKLRMEDLPVSPETIESQARRRVSLGLILAEIIKQHQLHIDAAKVRSAIVDMAKSYEQPEEVINWYYADKERLQDVEQMVLEEQAVDWILGQAQITETHYSFSEIMQNQQAGV